MRFVGVAASSAGSVLVRPRIVTASRAELVCPCRWGVGSPSNRREIRSVGLALPHGVEIPESIGEAQRPLKREYCRSPPGRATDEQCGARRARSESVRIVAATGGAQRRCLCENVATRRDHGGARRLTIGRAPSAPRWERRGAVRPRTTTSVRFLDVSGATAAVGPPYQDHAAGRAHFFGTCNQGKRAGNTRGGADNVVCGDVATSPVRARPTLL